MHISKKTATLSLLALTGVATLGGAFHWIGMVNYIKDENPDIDYKTIEQALRMYFTNAFRGKLPEGYDDWSDEQKNEHFFKTYIQTLDPWAAK